jgi:hypothetical protein
MLHIYGDAEIWKIQLEALRRILPDLVFLSKKDRMKKLNAYEENQNPTEYSSFGQQLCPPQMDLSDVPEEFKMLCDHFASYREKYVVKEQNHVKITKQ